MLSLKLYVNDLEVVKFYLKYLHIIKLPEIL